MLRADQLLQEAHRAAAVSARITTSKENVLPPAFICSELALIRCAIYTVGAEIIGRMDLARKENNEHGDTGTDSDNNSKGPFIAGSEERD